MSSLISFGARDFFFSRALELVLSVCLLGRNDFRVMWIRFFLCVFCVFFVWFVVLWCLSYLNFV